MIRRLAKGLLNLLCIGVVVQLTACGTPSARFSTTAERLGLSSEIHQGGGFQHRLYRNTALVGSVSELHVYLDGDGTPWLGPGRPSIDPTPRNPLVLELLALDPMPAVYLGRPCYVGLSGAPGCNAWYWTHGRYAADVVESLERVLRRVVRDRGVERLTLIGYSGGGALAMLLAERIPEARQVMTLAANLDLAKWTELHGYTPLRGSLDPARRAPLPAHIRQLHLVGENDRNVPPTLVREAVSPPARVLILPGVDHSCCWVAMWPELLRRIADW